MKVYVTKYCLTKGIFEAEGEEAKTATDMFVERNENYGWSNCYFKGEWFATKEEAIADAKYRVARKISSLKKSLDKFQKMKFE